MRNSSAARAVGRLIRYAAIPVRAVLAEKIGWGVRKWEDLGAEAIEAQWAVRDHERYRLLADRIAARAPGSVLEVGSGCGAALFSVARALPTARLVGIDVNPRAVEIGNRLLGAAGAGHAHLQPGSAENLGVLGTKSFDAVFSCAALIYVRPRFARDLVRNLVRIARRSILLMEMHSEEISDPLGEFHLPENWKRDYRYLFEDAGLSADRIRVEPLPAAIWAPGGGGAALIEVTLE